MKKRCGGVHLADTIHELGWDKPMTKKAVTMGGI